MWNRQLSLESVQCHLADGSLALSLLIESKTVSTRIATLFVLFTALHVMQTRYSDENSVCPSVCLSVCHTHDP